MKKNICLYYDIASLHEAEYLSEKLHIDQMALMDFERTKCISAEFAVMILSYHNVSEGPKKSQADFFRQNSKAEKWILVFTQTEGAYGPAVSKWKQLAMSLPVPMDIYAGVSAADLLPQISGSVNKNIYKCIVGFMRNKECVDTFIDILNHTVPGWEFECVQGDSLQDAFETAGKLILYGQDFKDFKYSKVEMETNKDLLLVYDCSQCMYTYYYESLCRMAVTSLRRMGWAISDAFSEYLPFNTKYEYAKINIHPGSSKVKVFWDKYGLPYREEELTVQEQTVFWEQFNASDYIQHWLTKKGAGI